METVNIKDLVDKKFFRVEQIGDTAIEFENDDGIYRMNHHSDCCEDVHIESIVGDLQALVKTPILIAEKVQSKENPKVDLEMPSYEPDSFTWTFYKFTTLKGYVDIRWWGESNGYYSEEVDIDFIGKENG